MSPLRPTPVDPVDKAHLTSRADPGPPISRYAPSTDLTDLVSRYWVPVWSLPPGVIATQKVLQYPVCTMVISPAYAILTGVASGLSKVDLEGTSWGVGTMFQPSAGRLLWRRPVAELTDTRVDLDRLETIDGAALAAAVRAAMAPGPCAREHQLAAIGLVEEALRPLLPVDEQGRLVNDIVEHVEADRELLHVEELCARFAMSERAFQRLTTDRLGLTPKWLIQRRRLHDATQQLKVGSVALADLASDLGYTDQAHFTRDFKRFTGTTPGRYLRSQGPPGQPGRAQVGADPPNHP